MPGPASGQRVDSQPVAEQATHLPRLSSHRPRGDKFRSSRRARLRTLVLILVHVVILVHLAHWQVQGRTLTPLEPSEAMQTLELGYLNAGFLVFGISILATLIFGRFFCGWACHLVALQDLCAWLLQRIGLRPRPLRSRLLVFVPFGIAFYMFVWPSLRRLYEGRPAPEVVWHLTTDQFWETFPGPGMAILTLLVCGFLVVWWMGAKGFCTYGCPYGAFYGIADRLAPGRILVNDSCEGCGHCTAVCTSNVQVHAEVARHGMVVDPGCMKCMDCVSVCPKEALRFGFARPAVTVASARGRQKRPAPDVSLWEDLMMAAVFLVSLFCLRGLYNLVPLLLAVALAALSAAGAVLLLRLLTRPGLSFQHTVLKRGGRLTRAGMCAGILLGGWFLFVSHSGVVRHHASRGENLLVRAAEVPAAERKAAIQEALVHLRQADRLSLITDGPLNFQIAHGELRSAGDPSAVEARLRLAILHAPRHRHARIELADLLMQRGEEEEAEAVLLGLKERDGSFAPMLVRLAAVQLRRGDRASAGESLDLATRGAVDAIRRGAFGEAKEVLRMILQMDADHAGARAAVERLRAREG